MADFLVPIDLNGFEVRNFKVHVLASDPALVAGDEARFWYNSTGKQLKYWNGTAVVTLGADSGGNAATLNGEAGAYYLDRTNHTGTQASATISDLTETVQDIVGTLVGDTATINATYDDGTGALTFTVLDSPTVGGQTPANLRDRTTHTGTQDSTTISDFAEATQDTVGGMIAGNTEVGITVTYDDVDGTLDFTVTDSPTVGGQTPAQLRDRSTHTGTQPASTISDFAESVDDRLDTVITDGNQITTTYDDVNGTLTIDVDETGLNADTVDGFEATALEKIANKNTANGYAGLDGNGKIGSGLLPSIALTDVYVVADITARDALTVQEGDVAIVTGTSETYIYDGTVWQEFLSPVDGVTTVTGGTGITSTGGTTPEISITAGGVGTTELADDAVTAAKVGDNAIDLGSTQIAATALPIAKGGTGGTSAGAAKTNLGFLTRHAETIGDGAATVYTVTHGMNTYDVQVSVFTAAGERADVMVDIKRPTVNTVSVTFGTAPAANSYRVVVIG